MRVLGLDIAPHAVACIEMDTDFFGRYEIRETHEWLVESPDANPYELAQQLIQSLPHRPGRIITSVPMELSTLRNIQLGTKDKKTIRQALEFELEDDLPFEKEDLHYDSVVLNAGPQGSMVHIGAVKKGSFKAHVDQLHQFQIDPDIITTDAWAYRSLFSRLNPNPDTSEPLLLLGIEKQKTFFYIHHKGRPVLYREINFGLKTIEHHLEEKLGATQSEIKKWIHDIGVSGVDERVSEAIADALELLVPELKQTELAARAILKTSIEQIYVTGEGALIPGLIEWLEGAAYKKTSLFQPLSQLSSGKVNYSGPSEIRYSKALALAMTMVPIDKLPVLNLRKGAFSKSAGSSASSLDLIKRPLPYLLLTSFIFFGTKAIEYNYYSNKLSDSEDTLKKAVKGYFGGIADSAIRTYLADTEKLKKTVLTDLTKQRELAKLFVPNANSPFDFLRNISSKIGKDTVVDLVHFEAGAENTESYKENKPFNVNLTFVAANAQGLAKLTDTLEKGMGLKKGPSEEINRDGLKGFKISYSGTIGGAK